MTKQKKFKDAIIYEEKAKQILAEIWERVRDEQYGYQNYDKEMFKRIDILGGETEDNFNNPLQW